jgi:hypothetical protein
VSRSGYSDDYDGEAAALNLYRGTVLRATKGKRGQEFFKALVDALDAMPEKKLIANDLETPEGAVCAIGALGRARNIPMSDLDPDEADRVAERFNIAQCLAREVVYMNDEWGRHDETPETRWVRMREWAERQISKVT